MKLYVTTFLALSLSILSCKKDNPKHGVPPSETVISDLNETKTSVSAKFANEKLDLLYADYLSVKAALVNTDVSKTQIAAKKMSKDFIEVSEYENARQVAVLIAKETDVKKQREFFVGLTDEVSKVVAGNITEGQVYKQMCPMAFEGRGAVWLSNSKEVRNPYFGDVMLACGAVMETYSRK